MEPIRLRQLVHVLQILGPVLVDVINFNWRHYLTPASYCIVLVKDYIRFRVSSLISLKPFFEAGIELFLRHDNNLAGDNCCSYYRTGTNGNPVCEISVPRNERLLLMPALSASFAVFNRFIQAVNLILDVE